MMNQAVASVNCKFAAKFRREMREMSAMPAPLDLLRDSPSLHRVTRRAAISILVVAGLITGNSQGPALAQNSPPITWKTDAALERQLDESLIGIRWSENPLRSALRKLSINEGVAILLDRRVDPDQRIDFTAQDVPLRDLLAQLASHVRLGHCQIGPVFFLGPPGATGKFATTMALREEEVKSLPAAARSRLSDKQRANWPELSEPREMLQGLATDYGLKIESLELVPHDVWPAIELPPLTFAQAAGLILAGFDLTFEFSGSDGRAIRIVPMPESPTLTRNYRLSGNQDSLVARLREQFPGVEIREQQGQLQVVAPQEVHEVIAHQLQPPPNKKPSSAAAKMPRAETRYTLKIENQPVGGIAQALAKRLDRQFRYDPGLQERLNKQISLDVKEVSLDELLQAVLSPAGLSYQLDNQTLTIVDGQ